MTQPKPLTSEVNATTEPTPGSPEEKELIQNLVRSLQPVKGLWLAEANAGQHHGLEITVDADAPDSTSALMRRVWDQVITELMDFEIGVGLLLKTKDTGVWRWSFGPLLTVSIRRPSSAENAS